MGYLQLTHNCNASDPERLLKDQPTEGDKWKCEVKGCDKVWEFLGGYGATSWREVKPITIYIPVDEEEYVEVDPEADADYLSTPNGIVHPKGGKLHTAMPAYAVAKLRDQDEVILRLEWRLNSADNRCSEYRKDLKKAERNILLLKTVGGILLLVLLVLILL